MSAVTVAGEVQAALIEGRPVVALESTIITHGMPWPTNLETALAVEAEVRQAGAVPATMAVLGGRPRAGLSRAELEALAQASGVMKLSRADLAWAMATGADGATTVAATMILAAAAGIEVFATGGIGGVHRGVAETLDISADLTELARSPVIVVCAGAKAILDLPKTLEVLETAGVPIVAFGQDELPAFWSRTSGLRAPLRADDAATVARFWRARQALGLGGGLVLANPVPADAAVPARDAEGAVLDALAAAARKGVTGKAVTPFLLSSMAAGSDGRLLAANIALVRANARLAAEVAALLAGPEGL